MDFTLAQLLCPLHDFPVEDPWSAGNAMHYYYLGSYLYAAILKLTGIPASIGYNFAIGTTSRRF